MKVLAIFKKLLHYKSFVVGLSIIGVFLAIAAYSLITVPYHEVADRWNSAAYWYEYPRRAPPSWISLFTGRNEIEGVLAYDTRDVDQYNRYIAVRTIVRGYSVITQINVTFNYNYDVMPSDIKILAYPTLKETDEEATRILFLFMTIRWEKPNGLSFTFKTSIPPTEKRSIFDREEVVLRALESYNAALKRAYNQTIPEDQLKKLQVHQVMFLDEQVYLSTGEIKPLKGVYRLVVEYEKIEGLETIDVRFLIYGTVWGLLGTDRLGRDLFMGIAWGTPIALSFGLLASLLTTFIIMILAAISAWYKGPVDIAVSRFNEIFMILPFLPTLILITLFYGRTLWLILVVVVVLSSLGSGGLKSQRVLFYQVREMPYIEAARAYGASSFRIVFKYMIPRVLPMVIPGIITSVPGFVFLEAALAILGISDPELVTWGKILNDAYRDAAIITAPHWIFAPSIALFLLSISFALIGFTLDRVFNPRLRQL